jgi:hypothetical protein
MFAGVFINYKAFETTGTYRCDATKGITSPKNELTSLYWPRFVNNLFELVHIFAAQACRDARLVQAALATGKPVRLLEPIGHVPPAEYERAYYDGLEGQAMAA